MEGSLKRFGGVFASDPSDVQGASSPSFTALILRSDLEDRVSKDAPGGSGDIGSILRDAAVRLLRMRAEDVRRSV